jgi:hypothetical protein
MQIPSPQELNGVTRYKRWWYENWGDMEDERWKCFNVQLRVSVRLRVCQWS